MVSSIQGRSWEGSDSVDATIDSDLKLVFDSKLARFIIASLKPLSENPFGTKLVQEKKCVTRDFKPNSHILLWLLLASVSLIRKKKGEWNRTLTIVPF